MANSQYGSLITLSAGGSTMGGMALQLQLRSLMGSALTGKPATSWWRSRVVQYTDFAMESIKQTFDSGSSVGFGSQVQARLQMVADMVYYMYIIMQIPGIKACPPRAGDCGPTGQFPFAVNPNNPCAEADAEIFKSLGGRSAFYQEELGSCAPYSGGESGECPTGVEPFAYWANAIGQVLVRRATISIAGTLIDQVFSDFLFMWEEFTGRPGARLTEMIGKRMCIEDLIEDSRRTRLLYVPLPFWFTQSPGAALVTAALDNSNVDIHVHFEELRRAVVVSGPQVTVSKCGAGGGQLQVGDLQAVLDVTHVQLTNAEAERYEDLWFEQLITNLVEVRRQSTGGSIEVDLQPNNPVIEMMWGVRRQCQFRVNNRFNFCGPDNLDPIISVELLFGSQARFARRESVYFRLVQPYQFHTNIPDACLYDYSFSLYPQQYQPSGAAPFGRLQNVKFNLEVGAGLEKEDLELVLYMRTYNLLAYRDGSARPVFARG